MVLPPAWTSASPTPEKLAPNKLSSISGGVDFVRCLAFVQPVWWPLPLSSLRFPPVTTEPKPPRAHGRKNFADPMPPSSLSPSDHGEGSAASSSPSVLTIRVCDARDRLHRQGLLPGRRPGAPSARRCLRPLRPLPAHHRPLGELPPPSRFRPSPLLLRLGNVVSVPTRVCMPWRHGRCAKLAHVRHCSTQALGMSTSRICGPLRHVKHTGAPPVLGRRLWLNPPLFSTAADLLCFPSCSLPHPLSWFCITRPAGQGIHRFRKLTSIHHFTEQHHATTSASSLPCSLDAHTHRASQPAVEPCPTSLGSIQHHAARARSTSIRRPLESSSSRAMPSAPVCSLPAPCRIQQHQQPGSDGLNSCRGGIVRERPTRGSAGAGQRISSTCRETAITTTGTKTAIVGQRGSFDRYSIVRGVNCPNLNLRGFNVPRLVLRGVIWTSF